MSSIRGRNGKGSYYPLGRDKGSTIVENAETGRRLRGELCREYSMVFHYMPSAPPERQWCATCIDASSGEAVSVTGRKLHETSVQALNLLGFTSPR